MKPAFITLGALLLSMHVATLGYAVSIEHRLTRLETLIAPAPAALERRGLAEGPKAVENRD